MQILTLQCLNHVVGLSLGTHGLENLAFHLGQHISTPSFFFGPHCPNLPACVGKALVHQRSRKLLRLVQLKAELLARTFCATRGDPGLGQVRLQTAEQLVRFGGLDQQELIFGLGFRDGRLCRGKIFATSRSQN